MSSDNLNIGGSNQVRPTTSSTQPSSVTKARTSPTKLNVAAGAGQPSPDAAAGAGVTGLGPTLSRPRIDNLDDMIMVLAQLRQKVQMDSLKQAETDIKNNADETKANNEKMMEKLKKVAHHSNAGAICAKVFAWVGVALSYVVAGVVGVVSGGAAAAPLVALAVAATAVTLATQTGLMGKAMDAMGMNSKAQMAVSLGITAIMLVLNIGAAALSGGATVAAESAEVAETAAEVAAQVGEGAAEVATQVGEGAAEAAAQSVAVGTEVASEAGSASVEVGAAAVEETAEAVAQTAEEAAQSAAETSAQVAEQAAEETSEAATQAAEEAAEVAADVAADAAKQTKVARMAERVRGAVRVAHGITEMGAGASTIESGTEDYKTGMARAGVVRDRAELDRLDGVQDDLVDMIDKLLKELAATDGIVTGFVSESQETARKIIQAV